MAMRAWVPARWHPRRRRGQRAWIGVVAGDCSQDRQVSIDEIIRLVRIALDETTVADCTPGDLDHDGSIVIDEIVRAVERVLAPCPDGGVP